MRILSEENLRKQIRLQIESAAKKAGMISEENVTDAELTKSLKTGAAKIAKDVPASLNDEMAEIIKMLVVISDTNRSLFNKINKYVLTHFEKTQKTAQKSSPAGGDNPDFVVN